jgi:hypothetical protein
VQTLPIDTIRVMDQPSHQDTSLRRRNEKRTAELTRV